MRQAQDSHNVKQPWSTHSPPSSSYHIFVSKWYEKRYELRRLGVFLGGSDLLCLCHLFLLKEFNVLQEGKVLTCRRAQHELLHQGERRSQVAQVEQLDGRVRVAARDLHLKCGNASGRQVRCRRIAHAATRYRQLVWRTYTLRGGNHCIAGGTGYQETNIARTGGRCDQRTLPDTRGVGQVSRVGRTCRREGIHDDGQVRSQACVGHLCAAQAHLFLDRDQCRKAPGERSSLQTTQEMQQQDAARAVVYALAGHARPRQGPQFGEYHHGIAHAHTEGLHLRCAIDAEINVEVGQ